MVDNAFDSINSDSHLYTHTDGFRMQMAATQIRHNVQYDPEISSVMTGYEDYTSRPSRWKLDKPRSSSICRCPSYNRSKQTIRNL